LSKRSLRLLTCFLSRQCRLRSHLKRIGLGNHGDCRFCRDEEETPQQLLCECDVSNIGTNLFGSSIINDGEIPSLKPTQLLAFIKALKRMRLASTQILVKGGTIGIKAAVHCHPDSYKSTISYATRNFSLLKKQIDSN